mmetsp:Transcript_58328/g.125319  ORF Transcript_58328/g.125319 Transcript_58328/m.125319 type:complete len:457 (-) Transcript_58328:82-1452(-)
MPSRLCLLALAVAGAAAAPFQLSGPRRLRQDAAGGAILLPLSRHLVEAPQRAGAADVAPRSYYVGNIRVGGDDGAPQELLVFFDTGSGQVILDSTRCGAAPCLRRHRYSPIASHAQNVKADGLAVRRGAKGDSAHVHLDSHDEAGSGEIAGDLVRDRVCLGAERTAASSRAEVCTDLDFMAVTNMTMEPFMSTPFDGIVGLGLEGLSIGPDFSFFGRLAKRGGGLPAPHFALFLPPVDQGDRAEVAFGGHNPARLASPLSWVPVAQPEKGFWQVSISSVSAGDGSVNLCPEGCRGVLDSSSSRLGVPEEALPKLEAALALAAPDARGECTGADIRLTLDGGITLTLTARDYAERSGSKCIPLFHPVTSEDQQRAGRMADHGGIVRSGGFGDPTFILGEPLLRRYYTVFDWEAKRLGFGLAAAATADAAAAEVHSGAEEFILLQCKAERRPAKVMVD